MELCDLCGHCADNPKDLKDHKKQEHPVTRVHTYKCKTCQQSFANVTERRIHVDKEHKEHKKVVCEICEMEFQSQARKKTHVDMMHGDSYLECDYCDKRFTKRGLKRHVTRVHSSLEKGKKWRKQQSSVYLFSFLLCFFQFWRTLNRRNQNHPAKTNPQTQTNQSNRRMKSFTVKMSRELRKCYTAKRVQKWRKVISLRIFPQIVSKNIRNEVECFLHSKFHSVYSFSSEGR